VGTDSSAKNNSLRERVGVSIQGIAGTSAPDLVAQIAEAERAGVRQIWITQGPGSTDVLTTFAAAFQQTREIRMGTSIVPIYPRHPLALAQQAATVAAFGPGRLRLGVGTSHRSSTEGVYGVTMESPLAYLTEYMQVLRAALWDGDVDHAGRFLTARGKLSNPRPVPLLMAALGENAYRVAGEISDGAISWNAPAQYLLDVARPALHQGAEQAARPAPPLVAHVPVVLSADRAAAREAAKRGLRNYARLPFYTNMWAAAGYPVQAAGEASDALVDNLVVMGDEATVATRLRELIAAGLDELLLTGLPVADPAGEWLRLARFVGQL
jgi:F420-dependent oxidoreductase-like protein